MSRFLESIENNMPEKDLDLLIAGKRALQRFLIGKEIKNSVKTFKDEVSITLDDGSVVTLEVTDFKPAVEDESTIRDTAETAAAVLSIPNPGIKALVPGSPAAKVQKAKKELANKLVKAAEKIKI